VFGINLILILMKLKGLYWGEILSYINLILMLPFGVRHVKHAVQRGILVTNSTFALGPRKTLIELADRRTFRM
jgi:hypothetical protein